MNDVGFERRVAAELRTKFPHSCKLLDTDRLVPFVYAGISRASFYGIRKERDIFMYLELMLLLGIDFEHHSEPLWARQVLLDPQIPNGTLLVEKLYEVAIPHVRAH